MSESSRRYWRTNKPEKTSGNIPYLPKSDNIYNYFKGLLNFLDTGKAIKKYF